MIAQAVLLTVGVAVVLLACAGLLLLPRAADRLHLLGLASGVGALTVVPAVVLAQGVSLASFKALLVGALLLGLGPILAHATGRAVHGPR